jgi:hypothetical protein
LKNNASINTTFIESWKKTIKFAFSQNGFDKKYLMKSQRLLVTLNREYKIKITSISTSFPNEENNYNFDVEALSTIMFLHAPIKEVKGNNGLLASRYLQMICEYKN